jgi:hypothetical protein
MADDLEQRIRERAYEIWENEGYPEGRGDDHWQQACAEYRDAQAEAQAGSGSAIGAGDDRPADEAAGPAEDDASPTAARRSPWAGTTEDQTGGSG